MGLLTERIRSSDFITMTPIQASARNTNISERIKILVQSANFMVKTHGASPTTPLSPQEKINSYGQNGTGNSSVPRIHKLSFY